MLEKFIQLNRRYELNNYYGELLNDETIKFENRDSSVCLVSCHGVNHYKGCSEQDLKVADLFTGGITELIAELTNVSFVSNVCRNSSINPYLGTTTIEKWLKGKIKSDPNMLIIDIHGAKNNNTFDYALGTCLDFQMSEVQDVITLFAEVLEGEGVKMVLNPEGYSARSEHTLTRRLIHEGHKRVFQVEISRCFRSPTGKLNITLDLFMKIIKRIQNELQ